MPPNGGGLSRKARARDGLATAQAATMVGAEGFEPPTYAL